MLITIALIIAAVALFYLFLTWNFDYWVKRGVAGPKPKPFTGTYPNLLSQKRHMAYDLDEIYRAYKHDEDFVGIFSIRSPQLLITSSAFCHKIYVNDFKHFHDNEMCTMVDKKSDFIFGNNPFVLTGEEWKERRALLTPGLTINRVKTTYPVTNKVCQKMSNYIERQIKMAPRDGVDAKDLCLRFTSEVVTDCVLGLEAKSFTEKPTPILAMIKKLFESTTYMMIYFMLVGFLPAIKKIYKGQFLPKTVENFFMDLMQNAINLRKSNPTQKDRVDFLNYMLQLQEKKGLTTSDLTANTMTFLLDGFETTAGALAHCLLFLARHPDKQELLHDEIMKHVDENGVIEFDKLNELPYLDACVHESIRIFPPILFSNKICTEPIVLTSKSGRSVRLDKGDVVVLPLYSVMLDEDLYPNPQEFKPERFLEENVKKHRDKGLFYGFGDGPRICMGMRFALTQKKAALVEICRKFKILVNPKTRTDNICDPKYFLASLDGGIWLNFEARN